MIFDVVLGQIGLLMKYSIKNRQGFHSFAEIHVEVLNSEMVYAITGFLFRVIFPSHKNVWIESTMCTTKWSIQKAKSYIITTFFSIYWMDSVQIVP